MQEMEMDLKPQYSDEEKEEILENLYGVSYQYPHYCAMSGFKAQLDTSNSLQFSSLFKRFNSHIPDSMY
jgi:hypothetical protein